MNSFFAEIQMINDKAFQKIKSNKIKEAITLLS